VEGPPFTELFYLVDHVRKALHGAKS